MRKIFIMMAISAIGFPASEAAIARPVTTDDCLGKGLCAYVSPKGRVTCGKCPGQFKAVWFASKSKARARCVR